MKRFDERISAYFEEKRKYQAKMETRPPVRGGFPFSGKQVKRSVLPTAPKHGLCGIGLTITEK